MSVGIKDWLANDEQYYKDVIQETEFRIRCCIPCIVQSYNEDQNTVECQPCIRELMINEDRSTKYVNLPLLINVPIVFPFNGRSGIKYPIRKNDEVLVFFSDLAIDNFWESGSVQNPIEIRRHDLSDGIAIPSAISLYKNEEAIKSLINFTNDDIEFIVDGEQITAEEIIELRSRVETLEEKVEDLETQVNRLNYHVHQVQIGDATYTTTLPRFLVE